MNTRSTHTLTDMNELNGYTGITRKPIDCKFSSYQFNRMRLQYPHKHAIMGTPQRKETYYGGDNDGKISYRERDCRTSQSVRGHHYQASAKQKTCRLQSRELVESQRERLTGVSRKAEEHSRQEMKKAGLNQPFTSDLVAVRSPAKPWKSKANDLSTSYERYAYINYRRHDQMPSSLVLTRQIGHKRACSLTGECL